MMPITARSPIHGAHSLAASGRIGSATRTNPYVPNFSRMAARITEPTVGASVWASGSQVWNGNIGTLMAKPMNSPAKISDAVEADVVPTVDDVDPAVVHDELELARVAVVEPGHEIDDKAQAGEAGEQGAGLERQLRPPGHEAQEDGAEDRDEDRPGQRPVVQKLHRSPRRLSGRG